MAITITPDVATGLTDITRPNFTMNQTVTASGDADDDITNVTATVQGTHPNLVITPGTTSVSITGTLDDPFIDEFTYIDEGQSDKTQTPITVQRVVNMPSDKVMYNLNQDATTYATETFTITVTHDGSTTDFTIELKIYNEWEGIRAFVSNYYD
tara:strand:+ start:838 stop:1299 length:462 start_codon:yes stop_codon:yes gene_type:complete